jgi:hypothetical protein
MLMRLQGRLWASLLAIALLLSAVDLHAPGEALDTLANVHGQTYSPSAQHPGRPAHFEPSAEATHPACPLCLHQMRTSGAHLLPVAGLEPLARSIVKSREVELPIGFNALSSRGARGPPSV